MDALDREYDAIVAEADAGTWVEDYLEEKWSDAARAASAAARKARGTGQDSRKAAHTAYYAHPNVPHEVGRRAVMHAHLTHAATKAAARSPNRWALSHYLGATQRIRRDVNKGHDVHTAIDRHTNGHLAKAFHKAADNALTGRSLFGRKKKAA